jgi:Na+/H+ antiporter NhaA
LARAQLTRVRLEERAAVARVATEKALDAASAYVSTFSALERRLIAVCSILCIVAVVLLYMVAYPGVHATPDRKANAFMVESANLTFDSLHDECMTEFHTHLDKLLQLYALDIYQLNQFAHRGIPQRPTHLMEYAHAVQKHLSSLGIAPVPP